MTDLYTKAVLTLIAICLAVIAFRGAVMETFIGQSGPVHVIVDRFPYQYGDAAIKVHCDNPVDPDAVRLMKHYGVTLC